MIPADPAALLQRLEQLDEQRKLAEVVEPGYLQHVLLGALDSQAASDYLFSLADLARCDLAAALRSVIEERDKAEEEKRRLWRAQLERAKAAVARLSVIAQAEQDPKSEA